MWSSLWEQATGIERDIELRIVAAKQRKTALILF
jgi:hypothetical protein